MRTFSQATSPEGLGKSLGRLTVVSEQTGLEAFLDPFMTRCNS